MARESSPAGVALRDDSRELPAGDLALRDASRESRKKGLSKIPPLHIGGAPSPGSSARDGWPSARSAPEYPAGWPSARSARGLVDPTVDPAYEGLRAAVRGAVRQELAAFFGDPAAQQNGPRRSFGQDPLAPARPGAAPVGAALSESKASEEQADGESEQADITATVEAEHFARFTDADEHASKAGLLKREEHAYSNLSAVACHPNLHPDVHSQRSSTWRRIVILANNLWLLKEPERSGPLAKLIRSPYFERMVHVVILSNCLIMGLSDNYEMSVAGTGVDVDSPSNPFWIVSILFQVFYTLELIVKLIVHRMYFFWNEDAGFNTFDLFLVLLEYAHMLAHVMVGGSTALRTVRVLRLGKALRALKVIQGFKTLRAILVCIQGSFVTLLWCVLMLGIVFYIFSLIFVQQAAYRVGEIGDKAAAESVDIIALFGTVQVSMLTLSKAAFGGEDWGAALDVAAECGVVSAFFYMLFISFSQVALINIITGLFVDSAMQSLSPNREQMAMTLAEEEAAFAKELEMLCHSVDVDQSSRLTKDQFNELLKEGRIPLLLHLLGLDMTNVKHLFNVLCDATPDNQVPIKSFVRACMRLKGAASSFDLNTMMSDLKRIDTTMSREFRGLSKLIVGVER